MKYGYYHADNLENAYQVDKICNDYYDIMSQVAAPTLVKGQQREEMLQELFGDVLPKFIESLKHRMKNGWLVANKLTIADFWVGNLYVSYATNKYAYGREQYA